mgnify:CR=1 FL=1
MVVMCWVWVGLVVVGLVLVGLVVGRVGVGSWFCNFVELVVGFGRVEFGRVGSWFW